MGPTTCEESIYAYLSGFSGLTALVGARIYPLLMPEEPAYPAVVYQRVSRVNVRTLAAPTVSAVRSRFQLTCWGETYGDAKASAVQVRKALQDFVGVMGGGVTVLDADVVHEHDAPDPRVRIQQVAVDVMILYTGGE